MEQEIHLTTFMSITGADPDVASHYLEACNGDVERAVDQYLDNTGSQAQPPASHNVQPHPIADYADREAGVPGGMDDVPDLDMENESINSFHTPTHSVSPTNMDPDMPQPHRVTTDELLDLPEGFGRSDLIENQMLESAILGVPFAGNLSEVMPAQPRPPSPSTLAAREIRQQQDLEFEESQRRDQQKLEEERERQRQEREARVLEIRQKEIEAESFKRVMEEKAESLPPEPSDSDPNSIVIVIRLPDGTRCQRRFLKSHFVKALFDFVDLEVSKNTPEGNEDASWWKVGGYDLLTQFPRRVVEDNSSVTLEDAGLNNSQEALFVQIK